MIILQIGFTIYIVKSVGSSLGGIVVVLNITQKIVILNIYFNEIKRIVWVKELVC